MTRLCRWGIIGVLVCVCIGGPALAQMPPPGGPPGMPPGMPPDNPPGMPGPDTPKPEPKKTDYLTLKRFDDLMGEILGKVLSDTAGLEGVFNPLADTKLKRPPLEEFGLSGPVATMDMEVAKLHNEFGNWVEDDRVPTCSLIFDEKGRMTNFTACDKDGTVLVRITARYTDSGKLREGLIYNGDGTLRFREFDTYDERDRLTERAFYEGKDDVLTNREYIRFNETTGRITETIVTDPEGTVLARAAYEYSAAGKPTRTLQYIEEDILYFKTVYTYDKAGRVTEIRKVKATGQLEMVSKYKYGAGGVLVSEITSAPKGSAEMRYDGKRRPITLIFRATGVTLSASMNMTYDSKNRVTALNGNIPLKGTILKKQFSYVADEKGNWIKQTELNAVLANGKWFYKPSKTTHRVITYYEPTTP